MTNKTETPTIVLKTVHNDILRDNPNATITTKQMRAKLRVKMNDVHVRNSSWIFTQSQYDEVRSMFDEAYRESLEEKAEEKKPARKTSRAKKADA